ncbi:SseB family protein [Leifsonia sp. NPDC058292]|uniref:SseB family protein n=1 Tax=Leifsonia sp. NPDC058292 TaxID=3346428 RepID=UPI0036DF29E4
MGLFSKKGAKREAPAAESAAPARLVSNRLVQAALSRWASGKDARAFAEVLRQCATGELLLDSTGSRLADPSKGFQAGDTLSIASRTDDQGRRLLLAYTSNERLAASHPGESPVSLVQPAPAVLAQAAAEYDGIAIDAGSDDMCIAYADEIRHHLTDDPAVNVALKTALVERTTPWDDLLNLVASTPAVFIAMTDVRDESGTVTGVTVPTARGKNGETYSVAFTSPAEVWAWSPPENAQVTGIANVARVALEQRHDGVLLNPAGQSVVISPPELQRFA